MDEAVAIVIQAARLVVADVDELCMLPDVERTNLHVGKAWNRCWRARILTWHEARVDRRTTLRYGEEDMAVPAFGLGAHRVADLHVVLMSLAATPEAENHGLVIAAARDAARRARPPAAVRIVLDESPYANRLAGDASLAPRLDERRRLWRDFVAGNGLVADILPLETVGEAHDAAGAGNR